MAPGGGFRLGQMAGWNCGSQSPQAFQAGAALLRSECFKYTPRDRPAEARGVVPVNRTRFTDGSEVVRDA